MKRGVVAAAVGVVLLLLAPGCTRGPKPAGRAADTKRPSRTPVAILLAVDRRIAGEDDVDQGSLTRVFRIGLDGTVRSLEMTPVLDSDVRPSADGSRILYSTQDGKQRTLREYDVATGKNVALASGQLQAWGWDGLTPIALTGEIRPIPGESSLAGSLVLRTFDGGASVPVTVSPAPVLGYSHALGGDARSWYFGGDNAVVRIDRVTGRASIIGTYSPGAYGNARYDVPPTEKRRRVVLSGGVRVETFATRGIPLIAVDPATSETAVEVRRASDWRLLRELTLNPPGVVQPGAVLSPDLTRLLVSVEDGPAPGRYFHSLFGAVYMAETSGAAASIVATDLSRTADPQPLAYLDSSYDLAYIARRPVGDGSGRFVDEVRILDRKTGKSRTTAQLGEDGPPYPWRQNARVVGLQY